MNNSAVEHVTQDALAALLEALAAIAGELES